jgi:translation initiation factor IF-3
MFPTLLFRSKLSSPIPITKVNKYVGGDSPYYYYYRLLLSATYTSNNNNYNRSNNDTNNNNLRRPYPSNNTNNNTQSGYSYQRNINPSQFNSHNSINYNTNRHPSSPPFIHARSSLPPNHHPQQNNPHIQTQPNQQQQQSPPKPTPNEFNLRTNSDIINVEQVRLVMADPSPPPETTTTTDKPDKPDKTPTISKIVSWTEALAEAKRTGLDLIEVGPNAKPPVVRLISLAEFRSKTPVPNSTVTPPTTSISTSNLKPTNPRHSSQPQHPYQHHHHHNPTNRNNNNNQPSNNELKDNKEIVLGTNIGDHDFTRQVDKLREFLLKRHPVKVTLKFKRSLLISHADRPQKAAEIIDKVIQMVSDIALPISNKEISGGFVRYFHPKLNNHSNSTSTKQSSTPPKSTHNPATTTTTLPVS